MLLPASIGLLRQCEERKRRSNPCFRKWRDGLLRYVRNERKEQRTLIGRSYAPLLGIGARRLRDQPLQFGDAGAAIGAGLQFRPDLGGRPRARGDGVADRGTADAK